MNSGNSTITVEHEAYGQITRYTIKPLEFSTPTLINELATVWSQLCGEMPGLVIELCQSIRVFGRYLAEQPLDVQTLPTFGLSDLRTRHLDAWEVALVALQRKEKTDTRYRHAVYLFALLRRIEDDHPGCLHSGVVARLAQTTRLSHIRREGDPDHSDDEVRRIRSAAHRLVYQALQRQKRNALETEVGSFIPQPAEVVALNVLLSLATGEPPEVLRTMKIGDIIATPIPGRGMTREHARGWQNLTALAEADGVQTYAVTLTKKRAGLRYEEIYDRNRNRAAHRTLTAILTLTADARNLTPDMSLWLTETNDAVTQLPWNNAAGNLGRWYSRHVRGVAIAKPHKYGRLRKVVLRRELIDNPIRYLRDGHRHTTRTLFEHYTNSPILKAAAGRLVVAAITDYVEAALGPTVITPDAEALIQAGQSVEVLNPGTAHLLLGGELDGALAACRDPEDSPFAPPGDACPVAHSGQCFTCPNAIITQAHLPALILLDRISDPRNAADEVIWRQVWEPIHKSTRRILPLFPMTAVQEATKRIGSVPVDLGLRNDQRGNHA